VVWAVGKLCGEEFDRLAADIEEALAISERTEERQGFSSPVKSAGETESDLLA